MLLCNKNAPVARGIRLGIAAPLIFQISAGIGTMLALVAEVSKGRSLHLSG